jgi:hypothetical protein
MVNGEGLSPFVELVGVATVEAGVKQAIVEREEIEESLGQGREGEGRVLQAAIGVEELGSGHTGVGILVQETHYRGQGITKHLSVGIQKKNMAGQFVGPS